MADDSSLELEEDEAEDLDHSEGADRDQKRNFTLVSSRAFNDWCNGDGAGLDEFG